MSMIRIIPALRILPRSIPTLRSSPVLIFRPISTCPLILQQSTSSLPSQPLDGESPSPAPKKKSSPTALFYRNLLPSMLHCLALGSIVYYALELLHNYLNAELVQEELEGRILILEGELEGLRKGVDGEKKGGGKTWWKIW